MAANLSAMSPRELEELIGKAQAQLGAARSRHVATVRSKIEALLAAEGLQLADVFPRVATRPGKRANSGVPKYRNPDAPDQTWTGHGKAPRWFVAALKKRGVTEATLLIDSPAPKRVASKASKAPAKRAPARRKK